MFKGLGIKIKLKTFAVSIIKKISAPGILYDTPRTVKNFKELLAADSSQGTCKLLFPETERTEQLPEIFNYRVSERFTKQQIRSIPEAYVVILNKGKVYGSESNLIISASNILSADLSREFGAEGGKKINESSILTQRLKYNDTRFFKGNVAVITTRGSANFHHWNYDCISRIHLLKLAGYFDTIDFFIIANRGLPFQKESLRLLNIPEEKIINPPASDTLIAADRLYVPSLPSVLGTVTPWVVEFLRSLYNPAGLKNKVHERIYISRKNVSSRHIINNKEFSDTLKQYDIAEVFPEDFTVCGFAQLIAGARFIISVHGSGLSNLSFISKDTVVVDILMPYHQDGYYWQLTNIRAGRYIGFFSEGDHPPDDLDLVKIKIENDVLVDIKKLEQLLKRELPV